MRDLQNKPAGLGVVLRAKFAGVLGSVPNAMMVVDGEGRVALANRKAEELFGYPDDEFIGKPIGDLFPEHFRRELKAHLENHFAQAGQQTTGSTIELCCLRKDGSEFSAEVTHGPVQSEEGTWVVTTIFDVTERMRLEKELEEKGTMFEAVKQELQAFSHSVSHDLRAPLRAMSGFAGMLRKTLGTDLSKESAHALKRIEDNSVKMNRLMDGLLDYSSLTFIALTPRQANPEELVRSAFSELTISSGERNVELVVEPLPACTADVMLLRQVFANLLSNAFKFTRDRNPAVIRVGCLRENGENVYFVQDNGVGFDMEYADKLFRVFQHLHSPSEFEGTGVGLAIVQRIIQRHGGRVWAEGRADAGATFYFTLGGLGDGDPT